MIEGTGGAFLPVVPLDQIPRGKFRQCQVGEFDLLLCRVPTGVYAIQNRCSHMGKALATGRLMGCRIMCPEHSAEFDVTTGEALSFPAVRPLKTFATQIREGMVYVQAD